VIERCVESSLAGDATEGSSKGKSSGWKMLLTVSTRPSICRSDNERMETCSEFVDLGILIQRDASKRG